MTKLTNLQLLFFLYEMTQQQIMNFWFHSGKLQASYVSLDACVCVRVCLEAHTLDGVF